MPNVLHNKEIFGRGSFLAFLYAGDKARDSCVDSVFESDFTGRVTW